MAADQPRGIYCHAACAELPPGSTTDARNDVAQLLVARGWTLQRVAHVLNISRQRVSQILREV